jgi:hypothetical protein
MSSNKKMQQIKKEKEEEPEVPRCDFCHQPGLSLKACAGCGCEKYCDSTCQKARWPHHKVACKAKRIERAGEAKAKEAIKKRSSGSGVRDIGSIMAALNMPSPPLQPQRYQQHEMWNATLEDHHKELQKMLRQPGLDVDWAAPGTEATATHVAAQRGNDKCLSLLISHGADMSKANTNGLALIHAACENGRYACIEVLADAGADLNLRLADELGTTPAMLCGIHGHVNCLALMGDRGADLSRTSNMGQNTAHVASQNGQLKCLQLLGKRGVDLSKKDGTGHTPLDHARLFKHLECIDYLLSVGATGRVGALATATKATKV